MSDAPIESGNQPVDKESIEPLHQLIKTQQEQLEHLQQQVHVQSLHLEQQAHALIQKSIGLLEQDELRSHFFANIAHEVRTPLTLILGPLGEALSGGLGPVADPLRSRLLMMQRNGVRLMRLMNQMLDLSQLEARMLPLQAQLGDLEPFIRHIVDAFAPMAQQQQITLELQTEPDLPSVYFDHDKLEKILYNLISNALEHTPEQGVVSIHISLDRNITPPVLKVSVRDTGRGIPTEDLPYIFDRYYQARQSGGGAGIGLALTQELVRLHGGDIRADSELDRGSTFTFMLPTGRDHLEDDQIIDPELPSGSKPRLALPPTMVSETDRTAPEDRDSEDLTTVLIIEDDADFRVYLRESLTNRYRVAEAANGTEGLQKIKTLLPDLVLSDVHMPGGDLDGYALCEAVKSDPELAFIPVILLTSRGDMALKLKGLRQGADDYLSKPFNLQELNTRIDNLIQSRKRLQAYRKIDTPDVAPRLQASQIEVTSADEQFLQQVQATVELHLEDEDFNVSRLAWEMGQSRVHLYRKLRALIGQSPAEVIRRIRLERAAQLLVGKAGQVSEIAYGVGFKSVAHFCKCFRDHYGVTPTAYVTR